MKAHQCKLLTDVFFHVSEFYRVAAFSQSSWHPKTKYCGIRVFFILNRWQPRICAKNRNSFARHSFLGWCQRNFGLPPLMFLFWSLQRRHFYYSQTFASEESLVHLLPSDLRNILRQWIMTPTHYGDELLRLLWHTS